MTDQVLDQSTDYRQEIAGPSDLVNQLIPSWIWERFTLVKDGMVVPTGPSSRFPNFIARSDESEQRLGFGQDILQNLLKYRNFDTYKNKLVQYNYLAVNGGVGEGGLLFAPVDTEDGQNILAASPQGDAQAVMSGNLVNKKLSSLSFDNDEVIELMDGTGFPERNGVILIDDEVILYRYRIGNFLYDLQRGASGTTVLPTFRTNGTYLSQTIPADHFAGSVVVNLSNLFLLAMLETIHKSYTPNIESDRVCPEVNRSSLLQNIKDFFASKGSKLGIKALFKMLFCENDVEVFYPGDRMITPSKSTWSEQIILRSVPIPELFTDPNENYILPDKTIGSELVLKSYLNDKDIFAKTVVDYASNYPYESEDQFEMYLNESLFEGEIIANPRTKLTRILKNPVVSVTDEIDTFIVTVETTLGFPDKGVIFIDNEAIWYTEKSLNQFLNCKRGFIGVASEHLPGSFVYGPFYVETSTVDDNGIRFVSRSWPLGLVEDVKIEDPGLLHTLDDEITINGPGNTDPRDPVLGVTGSDNVFDPTWRENFSDELAMTNVGLPTVDNPLGIGFIKDRTRGPDGIYFDHDYTFVSSGGFPEFAIGPFNRNSNLVLPENRVGPGIDPSAFIGIIPRRDNIKANLVGRELDGKPIYVFDEKGNDQIGLFIDGVRAFSNVSKKKIVQGSIASFSIIKPGSGYKNPTVVITPPITTAQVSVDPVTGSILAVTPTSTGNYPDNPSVRISSGEGASFSLLFDNFGRITDVSVQSGGRFYKDQPILQVVDGSGRGRGALINCETDGDKIISARVVSSGIDYHPIATFVRAVPIGSGAEINATVEFYKFDRYAEVINERDFTFDRGNGFLYEANTPESGVKRTTYGYICSPTQLRRATNDDGSNHSPILGFAFDGNPIYGPYGYENGVDDANGIRRMESGYILRQDRRQIIPSGGGRNVGSNPPSIRQFPMGTFVEDYLFAPDQVAGIELPPPVDGGLIETEAELLIVSESGLVLETDVFDPSLNNNLLEDLFEAPLLNSEKSLFVVTENIPKYLGGIGNTFTEALLNTNDDREVMTSAGADDFETEPILTSVFDIKESDLQNNNDQDIVTSSGSNDKLVLNVVDFDTENPTKELNDNNNTTILIGTGGQSGLRSRPILLNKLDDNGIYIETDVERIKCDTGNPDDPDPIPPWILGENNCRLCNTPEYPKELYPDGIHAYFITIDEEGVPAFPYIIGKTFCDRPISQVVNLIDSEGVEAINRSTIYSSNVPDETPLTFDFTQVERLRNNFLTPTKDEIELKIADVSTGSIHKVIVDNGGSIRRDEAPPQSPVGNLFLVTHDSIRIIASVGLSSSTNNVIIVRSRDDRGIITDYRLTNNNDEDIVVSEIEVESNPIIVGSRTIEDVRDGTVVAGAMVGDFCYFENRGTGGGGAEAKVMMVEGEQVVSSSSSLVATKLISHRQRLDLSFNRNRTFTFVPDTIITTFSEINTTRSKARVVSYDSDRKILIVQVFTEDLIQYGDSFFDNRGQKITMPTSPTTRSRRGSIGNNSATFSSFVEPGSRLDGSDLQPGDLWWSLQTGRLYIYYDDGILDEGQIEGSTSQWVCTHPIGVRPLGAYASDKEIGTTQPTTKLVYNEPGLNVVTISNTAPDSRPDKTPNVLGDLWWSAHTGVMYIWNSDDINQYFDPINNNIEGGYTAEWVCTDPSGLVPFGEYSSDSLYPVPSTSRTGNVYSSTIRVIISDTAPTFSSSLVDGTCTPVEPGNLWWSPVTGKMYIWFEDSTSKQWVVTNPHGTISGQYSFDGLVGSGGGSGGPDDDTAYAPIARLPELSTQERLFFVNTNNFLPQDQIEFQMGAPGFDKRNEKSKVRQVNDFDSAMIVTRAFEDETGAIDLPDGTITANTTRALYTVNTETPHKLKVGDLVEFRNSKFEKVNGIHEVVEAGFVNLAKGYVRVNSDGGIYDVVITDPGRYYTEDFYITFSGGHGNGGLAIAHVDPLTGQIVDVEIISSGQGYEIEDILKREFLEDDIFVDTEEPRFSRFVEDERGNFILLEQNKVEVFTPKTGSGPQANFGNELANTRFSIYLDEFYVKSQGQQEFDENLEYSTNSFNAINKVNRIRVTSPGIGYQEIPEIIGLYHREIDRGEFKINLDGGKIESIDVINGGSRYVNPIAVIIDRTNNGKCATAQVYVQCGMVVGIKILNGGEDYVDPIVLIIEPSGTYIPTTKDIGKIESIKIIKPGRAISADRSLKPEILIETRAVLDFVDQSVDSFSEGQIVYQGTNEVRQAVGKVKSYDPGNQIITLVDLEGYLNEGEMLYNNFGTMAIVAVNGQSDTRIEVSGTSVPEGRFIDQTSILSDPFPVIQDSFRFQLFSYVISSPIQQIVYDNFVEKITHPTGFIRFADVTIHDSSKSTFNTEEAEVTRFRIITPPEFDCFVDGDGGFADSVSNYYSNGGKADTIFFECLLDGGNSGNLPDIDLDVKCLIDGDGGFSDSDPNYFSDGGFANSDPICFEDMGNAGEVFDNNVYLETESRFSQYVGDELGNYIIL